MQSPFSTENTDISNSSNNSAQSDSRSKMSIPFSHKNSTVIPGSTCHSPTTTLGSPFSFADHPQGSKNGDQESLDPSGKASAGMRKRKRKREVSPDHGSCDTNVFKLESHASPSYPLPKRSKSSKQTDEVDEERSRLEREGGSRLAKDLAKKEKQMQKLLREEERLKKKLDLENLKRERYQRLEEERKKKEEEKQQREEERRKKEEELRAKREDEKRKREEEKLRREEELRLKKEEERVRKEKREEEKRQREEEKKKKEAEIAAARVTPNKKSRTKEEDTQKLPKLTNFFTKDLQQKLGEEQSPEAIHLKQKKFRQFEENIARAWQDNRLGHSNYLEIAQAIADLKALLVKQTSNHLVKSKCRRHPNYPHLGNIKLLQFSENIRPAYFGTYSRSSNRVNGRQPLRQDGELNYENDSDQEWEDIEGEDILESDEDDPEDDEEEEDDLEAFVVPDGYLSDEEMTNTDRLSEPSKANIEAEFELRRIVAGIQYPSASEIPATQLKDYRVLLLLSSFPVKKLQKGSAECSQSSPTGALSGLSSSQRDSPSKTESGGKCNKKVPSSQKGESPKNLKSTTIYGTKLISNLFSISPIKQRFKEGMSSEDQPRAEEPSPSES